MNRAKSQAEGIAGRFEASFDFNEDIRLAANQLSGDPEAHSMTEEINAICELVEKLSTSIDGDQAARNQFGSLSVELLLVLRKHRTRMSQLPPSWQRLPEFSNYTTSLSDLRILIGQLMIQPRAEQIHLSLAQDIETLGFRAVDEGLNMIMVHKNLVSRPASNRVSSAASRLLPSSAV
ncbi:MAG: hypothetical protein ACKO1L_04785 [Brachymonas sp.]